jgi:hypothetical protein
MTNWYHIYSAKKSLLLTELEVEIHSGVSRAKEESTFLSKFKEKYNSEYIEIQKQLSDLNLIRFFTELKENLDLDNELSEEMGFNTLFQISNSPNENNIEILAKYVAIDEILYQIDKEKIKHIQNQKISGIFWNGTVQTEFVQFIYGMIEADYISDKEKLGKIEIVNRLSNFFNFPLSKYWQDNLSSSIHDRNNDTESKIFSKFQKGWERYRDQQILKVKENKNKIE